MTLVLNTIHYLCIVLEIFALLALLFFVIDAILGRIVERQEAKRKAFETKTSVREMLEKERLRRQKEDEAYEGFFEHRYIPGFDANGSLIYRGELVPTEKAIEYYRVMDELCDTIIFENTEEL